MEVVCINADITRKNKSTELINKKWREKEQKVINECRQH